MKPNNYSVRASALQLAVVIALIPGAALLLAASFAPQTARKSTSVAAATGSELRSSRKPGVTFTVTNTAVNGIGSLRQAILDANGNAGADTIAFNIPASDPNCNATTHVCTITPTAESPLPFITGPVTIDGYSQPGASANTLANGDDAVLLIELDGSVPNAGPGLVLQGAASGSVIKGLVIDHGWGFSILVQTDTVAVEGCFIGIDPSGLLARPNSNGVFADFNTPTSGMRIGGTSPAARNVISGNSAGIYFQSGANHVVQGNFIGTDRNGTAGIANGTGIQVQQSDDALIGGSTAQARNIIASSTGIVVTTAARTRIQGNFIGTDVTGTVDLGGNTGVDVDFAASNTQIGGLTTTPGTPPGNVISGSGTGLQVGTGSNNVNNTAVMGNLIGTDAGGTGPLGNLRGVEIADPSNTVGGTDPMARNVISANGLRGILIQSQNNQVQGNLIGTDITGTQLLGNGGDGVVVLTNNNTIGGLPAVGQNPGNVIAGNGGRGVNAFSTPTGIAVIGNSIYSNGGLGIDLGGDSVTSNDHCDGDTGANNLQNYPVITSASFSGGQVMLSGTLDSVGTPPTMFRLEFFSNGQCDPSGFGEGQHFLDSIDVTTNGSCIATFGPVAFPLPGGDTGVTATATRLDTSGNPIETSEFSRCAALPVATGAASRKTHGAAGDFDVNLPLSGTPGIECRTTGGTNDFTMVVAFANNVIVTGNPQAQVTMGTATIGSGGIGNGGMVTVSGNVVTIPLTLVANEQTINVRLNGVNGGSDRPTTDVTIPMSLLIGDTNANRTVNAADVAQTKARLGQAVGAANFRSDVNVNGAINAADTAIVKQHSGTSLPP